MHCTLPVHPLTGARALGWRKARPGEDADELYPIWPILGGAKDDDEDDDAEEGNGEQDDDGDQDNGADDGDQGDGDEALGDKGKRALDAMKGKWKGERDKRRALEQRITELEQGSGGDEDPEAIRRQAQQEATAKANRRIVRAEIRAAAAGKLADPADALRFLDLDSFEVDDDGNLDDDEIADAIDNLVQAKPYLAAQSGKRFLGTADSGARKGKSRPTQLTREDVKRMSPEQIVKARKEGRLDDALGINR